MTYKGVRRLDSSLLFMQNHMNHMKICILINRAAALKIVVNIVCNKPRFEVSAVTDGICFAGDIQILRNDKFDAPDNNITAVLLCVGRNGHGFQTALVLHAMVIDLGKNHGQRNTPVWTDIL